jgi:hypothetical protein
MSEIDELAELAVKHMNKDWDEAYAWARSVVLHDERGTR